MNVGRASGCRATLDAVTPAELARLTAWRVVRISDAGGDALASFGSAVVVDGARFSAALAGRSLVLTCSHVCSANQDAGPPRPLSPQRAGIDYDDGERRAGPLAVRRVVWESPRHLQDAALLEVDELPAWSRAAATELMAEPVGTARLDVRITLRGYLMNQPQQLARGAVPVVAEQSPYLFYDVETGRGLSGAPLFDEVTGALLGLHRGDRRGLPVTPALASRHGVGLAYILSAARPALASGS